MKHERNRGNQVTLLVVDDEPSMRDAIAYSLQKESWQVVLADDGASALAMAREHHPSLIILDVMLPGLDGLQVCRILREETTAPILMLSARGEEIDRVIGLDLGADDYMTKPFAMRELIARVRANLRRTNFETGSSASQSTDGGLASGQSSEIVSGPLTIDLLARTVRMGGALMPLKPREFELLVYLAKNAGRAVSRQVILRDVWQHDLPVDTRTVDVHVRGIRSKLESNPETLDMIETVRGYGYRFTTVDS